MGQVSIAKLKKIAYYTSDKPIAFSYLPSTRAFHIVCARGFFYHLIEEDIPLPIVKDGYKTVEIYVGGIEYDTVTELYAQWVNNTYDGSVPQTDLSAFTQTLDVDTDRNIATAFIPNEVSEIEFLNLYHAIVENQPHSPIQGRYIEGRTPIYLNDLRQNNQPIYYPKRSHS